ncbi:MAG: hypothetical protein Q9216_005273 [Gyalolechia sp. 2 TL-2023]
MQRSGRDAIQILDEHTEDPQTLEVNNRITQWINGLSTTPSLHIPSSPADTPHLSPPQLSSLADIAQLHSQHSRSPADITHPYRQRLRPRPRQPLSTIHAPTKQQPLKRKRHRDPMDSASQKSRARDRIKGRLGKVMEDDENRMQASGQSTRSRMDEASKNAKGKDRVKVPAQAIEVEELRTQESGRTTRNPADRVPKNPKSRDRVRSLEQIMEEENTQLQKGGRTSRSRMALPHHLSSLSLGNQRLPRKAKGKDTRSTSTSQDESGIPNALSDVEVPSEPFSQPQKRQPRSATGKSKTSSQSSSVLQSNEPSSTGGSQTSTASHRITSKDSLALMNPPVVFTSIGRTNEPGMKMPSQAHALWTGYIRPAVSSTSYIPSTLKTHLDDLSGTPSARHPQLPANAFCTPTRPEIPYQAQAAQPGTFVWHPADHEMIREHVFDIHRMADEWRNKCDEDYWIEIVVAPLMHLVRKMTNFHHERDQRNAPRLSVINLKTREIKPDSLISTSDADLFRALNKKIDLAVGLRLFGFQEEILQTRSYLVNPACPSINHVQSCFNFTPIIANAEVKKKHQNRDPLIQLGAWVAAEFNKRYREGWPMDMPVVAITIEQNEWHLYIVHHIPGPGESFKLRFMGPVSIGTTVHYEGIFRILYVLCSLGQWGEDVYRPWFYKVHGLTDVYEG